MISQKGFEVARDALLAVLKEPWDINNSDDDHELFYGYNQEGFLGWFYIATDYPNFVTIHLGATFEEALAAAQGIYDEWKGDLVADGEWDEERGGRIYAGDDEPDDFDEDDWEEDEK